MKEHYEWEHLDKYSRISSVGSTETHIVDGHVLEGLSTLSDEVHERIELKWRLFERDANKMKVIGLD
jgi:hypothetical protein